MSTSEPLKIVLLGDATSVNVQSWRIGLERAGCEVHFLSLHGNSVSKGDHHFYPIPMIYLPPPLKKLQYFLAAPYIRKLIAQIKPDIVLAYFVSGYGTLAALSGFHPIVQITAGYDVLYPYKNPLMKSIVRYNLEQADLITAWAPHMAEAVKGYGISETKIVTRPRGIDLALFIKSKAPYPNKTSPIHIVSTRSLFSVYHIDKVIRAVGHLREAEIDCTLHVVGVGPESYALRTLTKTLGLDSCVEFIGRLPNKNLPSFLTQQDIYISVFDADGVSASLLEAMAVGVFPIVFDDAANRYWIQPGHNGLLVKSFEPSLMAEVIQEAITHLPLRQQAWELNPSIIRERADLSRNTSLYADHFRQIVNSYTSKESHQ